jgi:hypothetical protein
LNAEGGPEGAESRDAWSNPSGRAKFAAFFRLVEVRKFGELQFLVY